MPTKVITANTIMLLNGDPVFIQEPFGDLQIGDKVTHVGLPGRNGKITSGSRVDEWTPWVEYAGKVRYQWPGVDHACDNIAFRLPPGGIKPDIGPCYVLYIDLGLGELMRNEYGKHDGVNVKLFRAQFKKITTKP